MLSLGSSRLWCDGGVDLFSVDVVCAAWEDDYFMPCNSTCACVKGGAIRFGVPGNWHYKSASGLPVDCATATTPPSLRAAMPASASCQCSTKGE